MANILDYIQWRGDLTFKQSAFNEIDNLILAYVALVDFTDIVPGCDTPKKYITMAEAKEVFFEKGGYDEELGLIIPKKVHDLFIMMADSTRFGNMKMSCYTNQVDEATQKQFAAITFDVGDGTKYVSYSGTDDTLVGWKEDFNMMFSERVPAQQDALDYLNNIISAYRNPLRVGGHSKGGNLAVYAAMNVGEKKQRRIIEVYSNDGPGFMPQSFNQAGYDNIKQRVKHIVPRSSIVGLLMENNGEYDVVASSRTGLMQHDALSWQLKGTKFEYLDDISKASKHLDKSLKEWLESSTDEERRDFVDGLFAILTADGAKTLSELNANKLKSLLAMAESVNEMDKTTKDMISKMMKMIITETLELDKVKKLFIKKDKKENANNR